jgi:hypothetical protein
MALSPKALLRNLYVLDAVFLRLKQDQKKPYFFFKSAIRKRISLNTNNNKNPIRGNANGYGCRIHHTYSQDSYTATSSGRKLYYSLLPVLPMISGTFE